jgi:uncharacterized SAM-binding protein YcdF (DUF218 family)
LDTNVQVPGIQDVVNFLVNPLWYLLLGIILLIFIKKHRFKVGILLFLYAYLISIPFTGNVFSRAWRIDDSLNTKITYDAVIVLTGFSQSGWHLERSGIPYIAEDFFAASSSTDRILAGIYFVTSGQAKNLLVGNWVIESSQYGATRKYEEGKFLLKLASDMGVENQQLHIYGRVKRTLDEAEGVKRFVEENRMEKILLVTSEIHMRRALALFHKQELYPHTFSVNRVNPLTVRSFMPGGVGIETTRECLHELIGYIGYFLKGNL